MPIVPVEKIDSPYQQVYARERNIAPDDLYVPHSDINSKFMKPNEPNSQILHSTGTQPVAPPPVEYNESVPDNNMPLPTKADVPI